MHGTAIIRVNRHRIQYNADLKTAGIRTNEPDYRQKPVILVEFEDGWFFHAFEISIAGPSATIYRPAAPLWCGASCWMETDHDVVPVGIYENITRLQLMKELNIE